MCMVRTQASIQEQEREKEAYVSICFSHSSPAEPASPKCYMCYNLFPSHSNRLFLPQNSRTPPLGTRTPLLLVPLIERDCACMVPPHVIQVFDFVDADYPVLAREGLFQCAELGPLLG